MEKNIKDKGIISIPCIVNMGGLDRKEKCIASWVEGRTRKVQALKQLHEPESWNSGERTGVHKLRNQGRGRKGNGNNKFGFGLPFRENQEHGSYRGIRNNRQFQEICERAKLPYFREAA